MSCTCRKVAYDSRRAARSLARRFGAEKLVPYRCPTDTRLWHLTDERGAKKKQFR